MSHLRELYQEIIIEHSRQPRNFGPMLEANHHQEGFNPLCGDKILLHVLAKDKIAEKIMFEGTGCAISIASASLLTDALKQKTFSEIEAIFFEFRELVMKGALNHEHHLGKLTVLAGVAEFPARVKCATLAWHTMMAILENSSQQVTTE